MSRFLDALSGKNYDSIPVWFMRQAGRYLPSYQKIRSEHSLLEMFKNPHLASQITLLPFDDLDLDAAIIFSDILVVFEALGFSVDYPLTSGPKVMAPDNVQDILSSIKLKSLETSLGYVFESLTLVKPKLHVPILGFCGSPFTLLAYLLERPMNDEIRSVKKALYETPELCHNLLGILTEILKEYATLQIKAGADAFQIFDTASTWLSDKAFEEFSFPYTKQLVEHLALLNIHSLVFSKSSLSRLKFYNTLALSVLSVDWTCSYQIIRQNLNPKIALQGNLDPFLTTLEFTHIEKELEGILDEVGPCPQFIFNLGHGVLPQTRLDTLQKMIRTLRQKQPVAL